MSLTDLTAFVRREPGLALPEVQVITALSAQADGSESFRLHLPIEPEGSLHQLGTAGSADRGFKVFAIGAALNVMGDAFASPFDATGWANEMTSIVAAPGNREVSGGRILAWAPEDSLFPSGLGADGRLFTADDPLAPLEPGWSVIDLDAAPFERVREASVEVAIHNGDVPALIVDLRGNPGGINQAGAYLAGSFYTEPFLRSQRFAADAAGTLVWNADDVVRPAPVQWQRPVAVLIDDSCASVCEEFSAAMAFAPEHLIVGSTPTAGIEADIRFWAMPDGVQFEAPLAFFRYPSGELFVEGTGVAPNLRVPVTRESLLSETDEVLDAAVRALSGG